MTPKSRFFFRAVQYWNWLVVSFHTIWKIRVPQLGWWHSQLNGKVKKWCSSHHQPGKCIKHQKNSHDFTRGCLSIHPSRWKIVSNHPGNREKSPSQVSLHWWNEAQRSIPARQGTGGQGLQRAGYILMGSRRQKWRRFAHYWHEHLILERVPTSRWCDYGACEMCNTSMKRAWLLRNVYSTCNTSRQLAVLLCNVHSLSATFSFENTLKLPSS